MKKKNVLLGAVFALLLSVIMSSALFAQSDSFEQAINAYKQGNWSAAINYCKDVVTEHPDWFWGHYVMSDSQLKSGQYDNAVRSANKALDSAENNDESFRARFVLASAYYKKGDFKNALSVIQRIEQRNSGSKYYAKAADEINKMEGYSNVQLGQWKQAVSAFKPLVDSNKASADVLRAVAKSYQEMGQNKQSIEVISQVVRKDPQDLTAHKILIKSYLNDQQFNKSIQAADTAIGNFDRDAELHYLKGAALQGNKQYSRAEAEFRRSLALNNDDKTRRHLAEVLLMQNKFNDAALEFGRAQKSYADDENLFYKMAYAWAYFVPKDAEKYHGKQPEERNYFQALENARAAIERARELGIGQDKVAAINSVVDNKWERLEKGAVVEVEVEVTIDPETGEVTRKEKVKGEK